MADGWARVIHDFDGYSMGRFLREYAGFSDEAIEAIGTIENMTSRLHLSFFHTFLGRSDINPNATYWEIDGGSWQLPYALAEDLRDELEMGERMIRMEYWDPRRDGGAGQDVGPNGPQIAVHTVPEGDQLGTPTVWKGDFAIVTVPFSALRFVQVAPPFSYKKRRAIIETHYDQATKVLLEFSRRWWEFTEADWKVELDSIEPGLYEYYQRAGEEDAEAAVAAAHNGHRPPPNLPKVLLGAHASVDSGRIDPEQLEAYRHTPLNQASVRPATNCFGGGSTTDNPNRFMYYPRTRCPAATAAVWCWPATAGRTTRCAGTRWPTPSGTCTRCATSSRCTAGGSRCSTPATARPRAGCATRTPSARRPCTPRTR